MLANIFILCVLDGPGTYGFHTMDRATTSSDTSNLFILDTPNAMQDNADITHFEYYATGSGQLVSTM